MFRSYSLMYHHQQQRRLLRRLRLRRIGIGDRHRPRAFHTCRSVPHFVVAHVCINTSNSVHFMRIRFSGASTKLNEKEENSFLFSSFYFISFHSFVSCVLSCRSLSHWPLLKCLKYCAPEKRLCDDDDDDDGGCFPSNWLLILWIHSQHTFLLMLMLCYGQHLLSFLSIVCSRLDCA